MTQEGRSGKKFGILRHPLTVLLTGTLLTYLLLPVISARLNRSRLLTEARLNRALEIISRSSEVEREINSLQTVLDTFHKDNLSGLSLQENRQSEQMRLRSEVQQRYLAFDNKAWWWYGNLHDE